MPKITRKRIVSLDTETTGLDLWHGARPYFVTTAHEDGTNLWWEWPVDPTTRKVQAVVSDLLEINDLLRSTDVLVLHNSPFDYNALKQLFDDYGVRLAWNWQRVQDTLIASHLLASNRPHDLTSLVMEYLSIDVQPYEDRMKERVIQSRVLAKKEYPAWRIAREGLPEMPSARGGNTATKKRGAEDSGPWKSDAWLPAAIARDRGLSIPPETVEYANSDSTTTLALWRVLSKQISGLKIGAIYRERQRLLPIVATMESNGVSVDSDRLDRLIESLSRDADYHKKICVSLSGGQIADLPVNGVSNAMKSILFDRFKLPVVKTTPKGSASIDKFAIDQWIASLPAQSKPRKFLENLRDYRKKIVGVGYLKGYTKFWVDRNGVRILHSRLNPTGSDTLRFSSSNPNQQQVSKQEDVNLRTVFGPAPGREWWSMDYQNLELRIPAYESGEPDLVYVFDHPDEPPYFGSYHLVVADLLHPVLFKKWGKEFKDEFVKTWYQWIKNGNFAIIYGAQESTADRAYHVPGAYKMIQSRFPRIAKLSSRQIELANQQGFVETIPDRSVDPSRGYPLMCSRSRWGSVSPTVPLNYHVQGTAMWLTSRAMVRCQEYLDRIPPTRQSPFITMQVHDELVFDFPLGREKNSPAIRELRKRMSSCGDDIGVPTPVTVSYHPVSWGESEKVQL